MSMVKSFIILVGAATASEKKKVKKDKSKDCDDDDDRNNNNEKSSSSLLIPFKTLIKKRNFTKMNYILNNNTNIILFEWLGFGKNQRKLLKGSGYCRLDTPLHLCLTARPPIEIVDNILSICKKYKKCWVPEDAIDLFGRTPLHIAIIHGCTSTVIRRLTISSSAPLIQDSSLRLPLHWAAAYCNNNKSGNNNNVEHYYTTNEEDDDNRSINRLSTLATCCFQHGKHKYEKDAQNMYDICTILIDAYPEAVLVKDSFGATPLSLATDTKIKALLSHTTQTVKRKNSNNITFTACWEEDIGKDVVLIDEDYDNDDEEHSVTHKTTTETTSMSEYAATNYGPPEEITIIPNNNNNNNIDNDIDDDIENINDNSKDRHYHHHHHRSHHRRNSSSNPYVQVAF